MKIRKMGINELGLLKNLVDEFSVSQDKIAQKANSRFGNFFATSGASFDALRIEAKKSIKSKKGVIFALFDDEMPVGYLYAVIQKMPSYARIKKKDISVLSLLIKNIEEKVWQRFYIKK